MRRIIRIFMTGFLFIMAMEVSARIDDMVKYGAPLWGPYNADLLKEDDSEGILHNVPNRRFEKWEINADGFRGDEISERKPEGVKRIICMGTSESFGLYEDNGKEWPAQLRRLLSPAAEFEVINTSVVGLSFGQFKAYLERYVLKFHPDLVILYVNPYFCVSQISESLGKPLRLKNRETRGTISAGSRMRLLVVKLRILPKIKQTLKKTVPLGILKRYQIWSTSRQVNALEKSMLNGAGPLDTVPEEYLNSFRNNLSQTVQFLTERHVEVILSSYPVLISKENLKKYPEIFLDNRRFCVELSFNGMIEAPHQFRSVIHSVANDLGVGYVDNFTYLPKDIKYFGDNVHYTNQGARVVASNFAQYILKH